MICSSSARSCARRAEPTYQARLLQPHGSRVVVRNYEGFISTYAQPSDYQSHDPATCSYCRSHMTEGSQEGIAGLLSGEHLSIAPEGWERTHHREVPFAVPIELPRRTEVVR